MKTLNSLTRLLPAAVVALFSFPLGAVAADETGAASRAINRLGFDLYEKTGGENPCISPYSIQLAMAMVANGADGVTREEFVETLHYPDDLSALNGSMRSLLAGLAKHDELHTANRLFGQDGFPVDADFLKILKRDYSAPFQAVPFRAEPENVRQKINRWVEGATDGSITESLPEGSVTDQTSLAFANAIHFKDNWARQFPRDDTREETFYLVNPLPEMHTTPKVPTMHMTTDLGYLKTDGYTIVGLPFKGGFEMLVVVPDKRNGAYHLKEKFSAAVFAKLGKLPQRKVELALPKFEVDRSVRLKRALEALGLKSAFTGQADLSKMTDAGESSERFLRDVYHSTSLKVDEFGAEFAAATVAPDTSSVARVVTADHPFIYVIRDPQTNAILLMGRVDDPRK